MAPPSRFALLGRNQGTQKERDQPPTWRKEPTVPPPRDTKTMSKAERLLGVGDNSGPHTPRSTSDSSKRGQKGKGFASAFSDLRGVFVTGSSAASRNSSRSRQTPSSPAIKTATDSDSVTSMTSPTFDASTSTSTLPSYYDPPMSPYYSARNSSGPSSPNTHDIDGRYDYHAALNPSGRHKLPYETDMPAISEVYDNVEDEHSLPPLEMAPLSPNTSSTPKRRGSSGPTNRLRSASSTSVATESTARGKWLGWRHSRLQGRDIIFDPLVTRSPEQFLANAASTNAAAGANAAKPGSAVEDWLARADLERRPSQASTTTKYTLQRSVYNPALSPNNSELSIRTLTTQKDAIVASAYPPLGVPPLRHAKSSNDVATPSKAPKIGAMQAKDLLVDSVLSFSSSEEEDSSEGEIRRTKRSSKRFSAVRTTDDTIKIYVETSEHTRKGSKQMLDVKQRAPRSLNHQTAPSKPAIKQPYMANGPAPSVQSPKPYRPPPRRQPFADVEWQASDVTVLGSAQVTATDKSLPGKTERIVELLPEKRASAMSLSPTSKVMVVSRKEEKLLAHMRDRKDKPEKSSNDDSDNSIASTNPIIQVSPPRRGKQKKARTIDSADEMTSLDENSVLNFPVPPAPKNRPNALNLKLSPEPISTLPELIVNDCDYSDDVSLPSILLSPSIASRLSLNFSSVSDLTNSPREINSHSGVPDMPPIPSELYGSVPDLTEVLHTGLGHRNSGRSRGSSKSKVYITGLEHQDANRDGDDELEEGDITKYVMASCM